MTMGVECSLLESVNIEIVMCFISSVFMETGLWGCFLLVMKQTTALKIPNSSQFLMVTSRKIPENSSRQKGVTCCKNISG